MPPTGIFAPSSRLTLQDLRVLASDGLVVRVFGDVYADAGAEPTVSVRAGAVAAASAPGDLIGRDTAVWVHTGQLGPTLLHVLVPEGRRSRRFRRDCCVHESRAHGSDIIERGGLRLTTLHRSVFDVCAADTGRTADVLMALTAHLDLLAFDDYLCRRGSVPGRARIQATVRSAIRAGRPNGRPNAERERRGVGQPPVIR